MLTWNLSRHWCTRSDAHLWPPYWTRRVALLLALLLLGKGVLYYARPRQLRLLLRLHQS